MLELNQHILPIVKASVIGLGYIGLPTAAILASRRVQVVGVDICQHTIDIINRGEIHIKEPQLDILVHATVSQGYLRATIAPETADVFLIAVPTPFKNNHQPDLSYIEAAAKSIAPVLEKGNLIILESTSPVGTTELFADWLAEVRSDLTFPQSQGVCSDIRIAYCPERVLPGHILSELVQNDRIIGGMTQHCSAMAKQFYKIFVEGECIITDSRTAEMCKLTENSFRDVNIAFANELSFICDKLNINVWKLIQLANRHPRVNILRPGPGVGGHCIAVDPWFIVSRTPREAKLIRTAREVNDSKPAWVNEQIKLAVYQFLQYNPKLTIKEVTIACFGLAFKADIDDLRESPALAITRQIAGTHLGRVLAIEPNIETISSELLDGAEFTTFDQALMEANILVILVNHSLLRSISKEALEKYMVVDVSGVWC